VNTSIDAPIPDGASGTAALVVEEGERVMAEGIHTRAVVDRERFERSFPV